MAQLNNIVIQNKRSTVANAVPTTAELSTGELAINAVDGAIYIKAAENNTDVVVNVLGTVVADGGYVTN